MLKKLILKLTKFFRFLYKVLKVALGIKKDETGREDLSNLIEAGFIWLLGSPIILLIMPQIYNPLAWTLVVLSALIFSNIPNVWDFIEESK